MGCSPCVLDAALLAAPQLCCCTWNVQCGFPHVLLSVYAYNILWVVVCPGTPCMGVHTLRAYKHYRLTSSMLDLHQSG